MKTRVIAIAAMSLLLPFAAASCAKDSTGDLSKDEITKIFTDAGIPAKEASCMADVVKKADLTKDELNKYNGDPTGQKDSRAGKVFTNAITKCALSSVGTSVPGS